MGMSRAQNIVRQKGGMKMVMMFREEEVLEKQKVVRVMRLGIRLDGRGQNDDRVQSKRRGVVRGGGDGSGWDLSRTKLNREQKWSGWMWTLAEYREEEEVLEEEEMLGARRDEKRRK